MRDLGGIVFKSAIGIEQRAMGCGIDKGAIVVLAVDFDQSRAERAQHLHAHRLIVDEGAGAAIGELHPPHDQFVIRAAEIVLGEHAPCRMLRGKVEYRDHLALFGALAHQRHIAARAERQGKSIEQYRLAGAGLAGERGKTGPEIDVQPFDQDDVADREARQHGQSVAMKGTYALRRIFAIAAERTASEQGRLLPIPGGRVRHPLTRWRYRGYGRTWRRSDRRRRHRRGGYWRRCYGPC